MFRLTSSAPDSTALPASSGAGDGADDGAEDEAEDEAAAGDVDDGRAAFSPGLPLKSGRAAAARNAAPS